MLKLRNVATAVCRVEFKSAARAQGAEAVLKLKVKLCGGECQLVARVQAPEVAAVEDIHM